MSRLTEEQIAAVGRQGRVIVSASAGSGKTKVMIERIAELVRSGKAGVKEILAVTFTTKAAAQMREKLRAALSEEILACKNEEHRRALVGELHALPLAAISTIHAFCARLVRTYFFLAEDEDGAAGVEPDFRILDPDEAESLSLKAMDATFEEYYENGDAEFRELLSVYYRRNDAGLRKLVAELYGAIRENENDREIALNAGEDRFGDAVKFLGGYYKQEASDFHALAEELKEVLETLFPKALPVCDCLIGATDALLKADGLFAMAKVLAPAFPRMPSSAKAGDEEKKALSKLSKLNSAVKDLFKELGGYASEETERARAADAGRRAAALGTLVSEYAKQFARFKREAGALDYDDLEHYALRLLGHKDVCEEVRRTYRYVFVDEYQDVNPLQAEIIDRLAGENLFLVGDAKQAIYNFRGSRTRYFTDKVRLFGKHGGALPLTENFRSAENILGAVNRVFAPVIGDYEPVRGGRRYEGNKGEVICHRVVPVREEAERKRGVYSVANAVGSAETDALSEEIVRIVERERGKLFYDADREGGGFFPVGYGDIAVLVRKGAGEGERIVRALSDHGIPVTSSAKVNVCAYYEARLLIDWLSFLDNAEQDIPLAGAMLSVLGGFTDSELAEIRLFSDSAPTFRAACRRYAGRRELQEKLEAFRLKTAKYRAIAAVRPAAEVMNFLLAEGLEVQIAVKSDGANRLARVRKLVSEGEGISTHAFLRKLKEKNDEVSFSEAGGENSVKVVTMHASKGLEYPVVILASLASELHDKKFKEVLFSDDLPSDGERKFLIAPRSFDPEKKTVSETVVRRAALIKKRQEETEGERNLLYVGMTRARYRLHLIFDDRDRAFSPAYATRYSDFFDDSFTVSEDEEPVFLSGKTEAESAGSADLAREISAVFQKDYPYAESVPLPFKSSATALLEAREEQETIPHHGTERASGVEEGIAYHEFLQYVRFGADAEQELDRMKREGLLSEETAVLLDLDNLRKMLELPCLKALAGKTVWRERKFLVSLPASEVYATNAKDEVVFQGAIDLLCLDKDGFTVIDYKYSSLDASALKEKYAPQLRLYRKAVARAYRIDENTVRLRLVNIRKLFEVTI